MGSRRAGAPLAGLAPARSTSDPPAQLLRGQSQRRSLPQRPMRCKLPKPHYRLPEHAPARGGAVVANRRFRCRMHRSRRLERRCCLVSYYCSAVSGSVLLHGLPSWSGPLVVSLVRFLIRLSLVHPHSPRHHSRRLRGTRKGSLRRKVRTLGSPPRPWTGWKSLAPSGRAWPRLQDRRLLHPSRAAGYSRFDQFRPRSLGLLKRAYLLCDKKPKTVKRTRRRITAIDPKGGSPPQRAWRGHSPIRNRRYQHETKTV